MKSIEKRANRCAWNLRVIGHDCEANVKDAYRMGASEQRNIEHKKFIDRLTEMQGEYITLELIDGLLEELKDGK